MLHGLFPTNTPSNMAPGKKKQTAERFTVSLTPALFGQLDQMVSERGFASRSQAVAEMIAEQYASHQQELGDQVMAATLTYVYDYRRPGLQRRLMNLQHNFIKEIISTQHIHLENHHSMEVVLMQAPGRRLKRIADQFLSCKGVKNGRLYVCSTILPPLY